MTRRWSLKLFVGLVVGVAVLAGCSEKKEANDSLPTATASPTEDALPPLGPEDLPMPAEARTPDAAGAEAFVRYYIALINRTSQVMDAEPLREFSDGCQECTRFASAIEDAAAAGHDYEGGELTITDLGRPLLHGQTAELALIVDQAGLTVRDSKGNAVDGGSEPFSDVRGGAALQWVPTSQSWIVTGLTFG